MTSLTPNELYQVISKKNNFILLDVRNPKDFQTTRIEGCYTPETLNIPYFDFIEEEKTAVDKLPKDREFIVVCNKGNSSAFVAEILAQHQIKAHSVKGGILAWGNTYVTHTIAETEGYQIIQVDRPARGCLSYILISQNEAAVIDPARHLAIYQELLASKGARLKFVFDTHAHADHISGGNALAESAHVPYYLHPYDGIHPFDMLPAKMPFEMLKDGSSFTLGGLTILALHVPGHTLGLVNFLVSAETGEQYFFSGDSLFIQSFGRPDLGGQGKAWAPLVYTSLFETIPKRVPSNSVVLPGHYANPQEANEDLSFKITLADLFHQNKDLQVPREAFQEYVLEHLPSMPTQYQQIKRVNLNLATSSEQEASELEMGKNICALSSVHK